MKSEVVKPLNSKKENVYILIAFIVILVVASTIHSFNKIVDDSKIIGQNEISLYKEMNNVESGTYSEIINSLHEIEFLKEDGRVPDVDTLSSEEISPFFKDPSWENKGSIEWYNFVDHGTVYYLGISGNLEISGNFLISIDREDVTKSNVYYSKNDVGNLFSDGRYHEVMALFKKIVAYTGEDESSKFRGGK